MFAFKPGYFILTIILFTTEVLIALFVNDRFIRPYGGDVLVVILLYCFVQSFLKIKVVPAACAVLLFAYLVEVLQYLEIVKLLGLQDSKLANIVIGNTFQWGDMVAYTAGIAMVLLVEYFINKNRLNKNLSPG